MAYAAASIEYLIKWKIFLCFRFSIPSAMLFLILMQINRIFTKLRQLKLGGPVIMLHGVQLYLLWLHMMITYIVVYCAAMTLLCSDDIMAHIQRQQNCVRLSLYTASQLLYGAVVVFHKQQHYLIGL